MLTSEFEATVRPGKVSPVGALPFIRHSSWKQDWDLKVEVEAGKNVVIDTSTPEAFEEEHIPDVINMARIGFRVKELMGGLDWWKRDGYPTGNTARSLKT